MRYESIYHDKDDGLHLHKGDGYYEWWYFDAQFDNGYSCVLTWHWRNVFFEATYSYHSDIRLYPRWNTACWDGCCEAEGVQSM